jgi:DNA polymerase-3 subunit epsilon
MRQIVLDTETTGLSPDSGDRIVEIGCVELSNRRVTDRHIHFYVNPERANSLEALRVHGITDEFLASKPLFRTIADEFLAFVDGAEIIIHNAPFDVGFLDMELARIGRGKFKSLVGRVTDSIAMARDIYPGKSNSLDALCKRLEVDNSGRGHHGALLDAELLAEVYLRMTRGQGELVVDPNSQRGGAREQERFDLSAFAFAQVVATPAEITAHEAMLARIDKESKGATLWRRYPA